METDSRLRKPLIFDLHRASTKPTAKKIGKHCKCNHTKTDHKIIEPGPRNDTGKKIFAQCMWSNCSCEKFQN